MKKKVVILGAGYGGIFAAAHLCKENKHFSVSLIDKNPYLQLLQQIPYIISGSKRREDITAEIHELFANEMQTGYLEFVQAVVESIDLDNKTVRASSSQNKHEVKDYEYDYLVISLGSETQYFNIAGAKENSLPFRSVQDALEIQERISSLPKNSVIIIGGGGPTGVSLAAALSESHPVNSKKIHIKIIESSNNLLPGWDPRLAKTSQKVLSSKGVEILTGRRISRITARSVITDSDEEIAFDCIIWTAGAKGHSIKISPQIGKTRSDTIPVDNYFRISGFQSAYAIGDICEFQPDKGNDGDNDKNSGSSGAGPLPKLAQLAVRQARFVAENIIRKEKGQDLKDKFDYYQRGHSISLGNKNLAVLSGLLVTGDMCNYTEDTIVDNFVIEIKNREKGVSAKALAATKDTETVDYPAAFDFVTYAVSDAFSDLVR
jgi:NADH:ubiquinone reductase (H+-translocating)